MPLRVTAIERIPIHLPFRASARPWLEVDIGPLRDLDIFRVATSDPDIVGWGECLSSYGTRGSSQDAIARTRGANPAELAWDDSLGQGLQMALLDILGKHHGVPVWQLLRPTAVRTECPISWWSSGFTPIAEFATETRAAVAAGYRTQKMKARPWLNVFDQVDAVSAASPANYKVDLDWNGMLQSRGEAAEVLTELDKRPRAGIYESPLAPDDADGLAALRRQVARPVVEHFREGHAREYLHADAVDGFVLFQGGATNLLRHAEISAAFAKSSWLQVLGSSLTTAFVLQLAAVASSARWPIVTMMNVYDDDLLCAPLQLAGGAIAVPHGPGLGVSVDADALEGHRVHAAPRHQATREEPDETRRLLVIDLGGSQRVYTNSRALHDEAHWPGWSNVQPAEVELSVEIDDGSAEFDRTWATARAAGR